jgi:selT/selW/selH-like putative selenoprotein
VDAELVKGDDGVFDVLADGRLVFSKHEQGRFPSDAEVLARLAEGAES